MHMRMPDLSEYDLHVVTSFPKRGCVIGVRPFTPEASPRHVLNDCGVVVVDFSFFSAGMWFLPFQN